MWFILCSQMFTEDDKIYPTCLFRAASFTSKGRHNLSFPGAIFIKPLPTLFIRPHINLLPLVFPNKRLVGW